MSDKDTFGLDLGWGKKPLLLVIDVTRAFTEPDRALGSDATKIVDGTNRLISVARNSGLPIIFTRVAYAEPDLSDAGMWSRKIGRLEDLIEGSEGVEMDKRLDFRDKDQVLTKKYASCFFGTDLASRLTSAGIDTLIIAGLSTSGCVRATAVDAIQFGFRPIVVEDAVGDRWQAAHDQTLADLRAKYADLEPLSDVCAKMEELA